MSNTVLAEDMQYTAKTTVANRSAKRSGLSQATETTIKRHRPPKADKAQGGTVAWAAIKTVNTEVKDLTEVQVVQLDKVLEQAVDLSGIHTKRVQARREHNKNNL